MVHRITYNDALLYWSEMYEVEKKIRASHCRKRNFPLNEFNWWIRSAVMNAGQIVRPAFLFAANEAQPRIKPEGKILARLVATTQGTSYSSGLIVPVPDWVLKYWGRN